MFDQDSPGPNSLVVFKNLSPGVLLLIWLNDAFFSRRKLALYGKQTGFNLDCDPIMLPLAAG